MSAQPEPAALTLDDGQRVSALWLLPPHLRSVLVLAHGAGAGMSHPFMVALAEGLAHRGIGTLRYQFPYMERGTRRPDTPRVAKAAVRAAVAEAGRRLPGLPLFAGGKSFGGRMSSQAQAAEPLPGVRGLVFVGFPLHAAGDPSRERADHLARVTVPMLFLQGTRDELAELGLIRAVVGSLDVRATLKVL
ncbi:MAG TPA: alpha/beta family hydrolase, partial [Albitalea sp.]